MIISIIVAIGNNRVIGINNDLPWDLPADMEHFRQLTAGKPVIMGQKTFESIGRALPGRKNIILTRDKDFRASGCSIVFSVEEALEAAEGAEEVMIIGGVSIYSQFLPLAKKMYLTLVKGNFAGDAYFPKFNPEEWIETEHSVHASDKENAYPYSFVVLEKRKAL